MVEFIRHLLGFCGEHSHPNIFNILVGTFGIGTTLAYIRYRFFTKKN